MSYIGSRPEQSTTAEAALLTALFNLAPSGGGFAIAKNGDGTFSNVSTGGGGGGSAIGGTVTGATQGSILFIGPAGVLAQDNAKFFWDDTNTILKIGGTPAAGYSNGNDVASFTGNSAAYIDVAVSNNNAGNLASADLVVSNDTATTTTNYGDFGIASSTNADPSYTAFPANSVYLYSQSSELDFATASASPINFFTGGTLLANKVFSLSATGNATFLANGAASTAAVTLNGTIFTGGTGTTNFPQLLIQPTGTTAVTTWSTNGTGIGMNMPTGFSGNFLHLHVNGGNSVFTVTSGGGMNTVATISANGDISTGSGSGLRWTSSTQMRAATDGTLVLSNNAQTAFTTLQFGGTTSSFPSIRVNGTTLGFKLSDNSADSAMTAAAGTFSGQLIVSVNGTVSASPVQLTGTILTGGTGTTNFPQVLVQPTGTTAVTTWSTNGTIFGVNAASGFAGSFLDFRSNGGSSLFSISSIGSVVTANNVIANGNITAGIAGQIAFNSRSSFTSSADGLITLNNAAASGFTALLFGGTTASFPSLRVSGTTLQFRLADNSADSPMSASTGTFSGHMTMEGVTSTGATGTGLIVFGTSPSLTTPTLGVASATTINKVTITAPASSATLTIADGKTLTVSQTMTLTSSGTSSVITFPNATDTVGGLGTAQTWTAQNKFNNFIDVNNAIAAVSNAATVPVTFRVNTVTNSSAATLTITMATASAVDGQLTMVRVLDFSAVAQTITWVNTENSTVTIPTTSNGSTTLPLSVALQYNAGTSKWRCIAFS